MSPRRRQVAHGYPGTADPHGGARAVGADAAQVTALMNQVELISQQALDWHAAPVVLASTQHLTAEQEAGATTISGFEPAVIPGLLQTSEYARALTAVFRIREFFLPGVLGNPVASVAEAVATRISRQEVLAVPDKTFRFVIMKATLSNRFCEPEDMLGQISRLRTVNEQFAKCFPADRAERISSSDPRAAWIRDTRRPRCRLRHLQHILEV